MAAVWVPLERVMKFPEVLRVYKRAGRGQGTGQGIIGTGVVSSQLVSAPKGFLQTVKNFVQGPSAASTTGQGAALPAWIRRDPLASNDWSAVQIDVTAIPGVRKLRKDGKWASAS